MPKMNAAFFKSKPALAALALAALACVAAALYYGGALGPRASKMPGIPPVVGTLTAVTPTSVTIADQKGKATVFVVNAQTQVITQVAAGETGKALAELPLQVPVLVGPSAADRTVAAVISPLPHPPMPQQGIMLTSAQGAIVSRTATSIVLQKDDNAVVRVQVGPSTRVLSSVVAGEKGAELSSLSAGDYIGAIGTLNAEGGIDAQEIQIQRPVAVAAPANIPAAIPPAR